MAFWRVGEDEQPPEDFLRLLEEEDQGVDEIEQEEDCEWTDGDSGEEAEVESDEDEVPHHLYPPPSSLEQSRLSSPGVGDGDSSPQAPPYSLLSSPERIGEFLTLQANIRHHRYQSPSPPQSPRVSRNRSRSPLVSPLESAPLPVADVVVQIFDEFGTPLDALDSADGEYIVEYLEDEFLDSDTHALYESPNVDDERDRDVSNRRMSSGGRSVRGRRMRGQGSRAGRSARGRGYMGGANRGRGGGHQWVEGQPLTEIYMNDADVPPEFARMAMDILRRRQGLQDAAARRVERMMTERENTNEGENDDVYEDASDGVDTLPGLEGQNVDFEWSSMETFQGKEELFRPERTGSVHIHNTPYDAFRSFWSEDIIGLIVCETNLYASKISSADFQSSWFPTNSPEILCLFSFWMMLGIVKMPTITSCFSVDPLLKTDIFRSIFTRKRYQALVRALHFVDSDPSISQPGPSNASVGSFDRLNRLRPIITHLNSAFQSNYILSRDICIDESLTLWKGRLSFKQYIRSKVSKFGIKTFELCESTTGYLWSFIVYTGKQSTTELGQSPGVLQSTAVVKKLIGPLLNKGYRLFMDNWYHSPLLARFLKLNGTDCVGTLRASRRDVPFIIRKAPLKKGEYVARHSGDVSLLSWLDKKRVTLISTCHGSSLALPTVSSRPPSRPVPFKPQMVLDYNKFMGGVDIKDQMLEPYLLERKRCSKWYMKLFKRLLNISILNSRILLESSTQKHHDHLAFRLQLVDTILTNHLSHCPGSRQRVLTTRVIPLCDSDRYTLSTHWPVLLEPTDHCKVKGRNFFQRCVYCISKGQTMKKTNFCCESCRVSLCVQGGCFKLYHTPPPPT